MNLLDYRDRIWYNFQDSERRVRYYSRHAYKLDSRHKKVAYSISAFTVIALVILQINIERLESFNQNVVTILLLIVALIELVLIHFDLGANAKVARVIAIESVKVANEWRILWFGQEVEEPARWVNFLEEQTRHIGGESIQYDKKLNEVCAKEVSDEFEELFWEHFEEKCEGQRSGAG